MFDWHSSNKISAASPIIITLAMRHRSFMGTQIKKVILNSGPLSSHALLFIPDKIKMKGFHLSTHGYTADKGSILNWATRMAELGLPSAIFDLPGHYLGSYNEVEDFEDFSHCTPQLFIEALTHLKKFTPIAHDDFKLFLSGHSLGALMAIKALELPFFQENKKNTYITLIGFGLSPHTGKHLFESTLFEKTMEVRAQLVSPALHPKVMLPWIRTLKGSIHVSGYNFYLITGEDDIVVGKEGSEHMAEILQLQGNHVQLEKPTRLPHNQPELATSYLASFIRGVLDPKLHVL